MWRAGFVLMLTIIQYIWIGGTLAYEPVGIVDFAIVALKELLIGFVFGFAAQLFELIIRFGSAVIDFSMGLSMAQVYDPQNGAQMTVSTGLYYTLMMMLFLAMNCHVRFIEIVFRTAEVMPFGAVEIRPELATYILQLFCQCMLLGFEFAFPIMGIELLCEVAIGILMRVVPQINIFVVNFQIKIGVGMTMMLILFTPIGDRIKTFISMEFDSLYKIVGLMS